MENLFLKIGESWEEPDGFFYMLRDQHVDFQKGNALLELLGHLDFDEHERIEKYKISLLWYIPIYMEWQFERLKDFEKDKEILSKYSNLQGLILNEVERILGTP
jgi:hypothetical protein